MKILRLVLAVLLIPAGGSAQQGFSCSYGDRGACLGFGETVCSSSGICVDQNAACFDRYQCNHEGFTCKSNVTECAAAHDKLLRANNTLVDEYNGLLKKHNDLIDDFNENLEIAKDMAARLDDIESCLIYASTLEAARLCAQ